MTRSRDDPMPG